MRYAVPDGELRLKAAAHEFPYAAHRQIGVQVDQGDPFRVLGDGRARQSVDGRASRDAPES
ncbi:hypothetical protein ACWC0A_22870 [Streptomyces scopuliridis]